MKNKNSFSVIIPLFNKEKSILSTVNSVLNQSYKDFELLIINDGSTDNSRSVINNIKDNRLRIIDKENGGVSSARNRGIKEAKNEWIAFIDGDDIWHIDHLKIMSQLIEKYHNFYFFSSSVSYDNKKLGRMGNDFIINNYFSLNKSTTYIHTDGIVVNKDCFNKAGFFKENICKGEDLDMWRRLARYYKIVKSESITAYYRLDAENRACNRQDDINKSALWNINLRDKELLPAEVKYLKKQIIKSVLYLFYRRKVIRGSRLLLKHIKDILFY